MMITLANTPSLISAGDLKAAVTLLSSTREQAGVIMLHADILLPTPPPINDSFFQSSPDLNSVSHHSRSTSSSSKQLGGIVRGKRGQIFENVCE